MSVEVKVVYLSLVCVRRYIIGQRTGRDIILQNPSDLLNQPSVAFGPGQKLGFLVAATPRATGGEVVQPGPGGNRTAKSPKVIPTTVVKIPE